MPDTLDASRFELPLAALIDATELPEAESKWASSIPRRKERVTH